MNLAEFLKKHSLAEAKEILQLAKEFADQQPTHYNVDLGFLTNINTAQCFDPEAHVCLQELSALQCHRCDDVSAYLKHIGEEKICLRCLKATEESLLDHKHSLMNSEK